MKYPSEQYHTLVESLKVISNNMRGFDIRTANESNLHYMVYQNLNSGQRHNKIGYSNGKLCRSASLVDGYIVWADNFKPLLSENDNFKLYPEGCNDSHIITAVKRAVNEITN